MDSGIPAPQGFLPQPWKALAKANPEAKCVALLTYFHLSSFGKLLPFLRMSQRVSRQVESSPGALGYRMMANPLSLRFWTLSAWETAEHDPLNQFIRQAPHRDAMRNFGVASGVEFRSLRWQVKGSELPLTWKAAAAHL